MLCCVVLCCVVLRCVALRCVVLCCVVLCCVVLCCVVLRCAVLCGAVVLHAWKVKYTKRGAQVLCGAPVYTLPLPQGQIDTYREKVSIYNSLETETDDLICKFAQSTAGTEGNAEAVLEQATSSIACIPTAPARRIQQAIALARQATQLQAQVSHVNGCFRRQGQISLTNSALLLGGWRVFSF